MSAGMHRILIATLLLMAPLPLAGTSLAGSDDAPAEAPSQLLGRWVQDETGPLLMTRKVFTFRPDGTYGFVLTGRPPGSANEHVLERDVGRYTVQANRLLLHATSGIKRTYRFEVGRDPVLGQPSLVLADADGARNTYHR